MKNENRVLVRPRINLVKTLMRVLFVLLADAFAALSLCFMIDLLIPCISTTLLIIIAIVIFVGILVYIIVMNIKEVAIYLILLYQRFAPSDVRLRCVYTPSCSEYMRLSIEKYGFREGVKKGWARLNRCHYPNSGEDYP